RSAADGDREAVGHLTGLERRRELLRRQPVRLLAALPSLLGRVLLLARLESRSPLSGRRGRRRWAGGCDRQTDAASPESVERGCRALGLGDPGASADPSVVEDTATRTGGALREGDGGSRSHGRTPEGECDGCGGGAGTRDRGGNGAGADDGAGIRSAASGQRQHVGTGSVRVVLKRH